MQDKRDIAPVDAHAEGRCGSDDGQVPGGEPRPCFPPFRHRQARMVPRRVDSLLPQEAGHPFHRGVSRAIDDAAASPEAFHFFPQGPVLVPGPPFRQKQVGPVKPPDYERRPDQGQMADDILPHERCRRRRKRRVPGPRGKGAQKIWDGQVGRTEIMPPLGHAMGLVHDHERRRIASGKTQEIGVPQAFRRCVQKTEPPFLGFVQGPVVCIAPHERIDMDRRDAPGPQVLHLILHQGNKGRNDQGIALQNQARHLEAEGLAASRRQNGQHVPSCQDGRNDFPLPRTEGSVPEPAAQGRLRRAQGTRSPRLRAGLGARAKVRQSL